MFTKNSIVKTLRKIDKSNKDKFSILKKLASGKEYKFIRVSILGNKNKEDFLTNKDIERLIKILEFEKESVESMKIFMKYDFFNLISTILDDYQKEEKRHNIKDISKIPKLDISLNNKDLDMIINTYSKAIRFLNSLPQTVRGIEPSPREIFDKLKSIFQGLEDKESIKTTRNQLREFLNYGKSYLDEKFKLRNTDELVGIGLSALTTLSLGGAIISDQWSPVVDLIALFTISLVFKDFFMYGYRGQFDTNLIHYSTIIDEQQIKILNVVISSYLNDITSISKKYI